MYYSQKDERWANKKVGFGSLTFSAVGCAVVSIANKLKYDGIDMTPLEVNEFAKKCGAFNVDMLNFSKLANALGYDYVKQTAKPEGRQIGETNYYKKVGSPQHFVFLREDGKRIDPLDPVPSWELNNYPIISYRVFKVNKTTKFVDIKEKMSTEPKEESTQNTVILAPETPQPTLDTTSTLETTTAANNTLETQTYTVYTKLTPEIVPNLSIWQIIYNFIINNKMTPQKKFLRSLCWNMGIYAVLYALDFTAKNLGMFNLDPTTLAVVSIVIARVTKMINVYIQANKELE